MPRTFTQTITTTLYTFQELLEAPRAVVSEKAVDKARNWLQEGNNHDDFWSEDLVETWKLALDQIGFEDAQIQWSGFSSQGDGASFTAGPDLEKLVNFLVTRWSPERVITMRADGKTEEFRPWVCDHVGWTGGEKQFAKLLTWYRERDLDLELECRRSDSHYCHAYTCNFTAYLRSISYKQAWRQQAAEKAAEALVQEFEERVEGLRKDLCREIYKSLENAYEFINSAEALADTAEANNYLFTASGRREDPPSGDENEDEGTVAVVAAKPAATRQQLLDRLRAKRKLVRHG